MPDTHVTQKDCDRRHWLSTGMITLLISLMGLLMIIVGWSGCASVAARSEVVEAQAAVAETQKSVDVHASVAKERNKAISASLERIEATQVRMDDRQNAFYKRNGG